MRDRTRGSVRFDTYYKVQWWDNVSLTWRDIQQNYPTREQAEATFAPGKTCRVMEITMRGRSVVGHAATFQNNAPGNA